ncbi:MAG: polymer-forming cytoskeletal protein [Proteobacteria bacterium]|nr:polymer-forming cytoskeletal protein [Pseudomonadota bacterium]MBU4471669.1 polymer-forming cytoskeletal protein [Pseudomonadota bacterium]MCG2750646.1 polymer-forming cytoskeletal protein [Desulfobacteraceae bacterium]
MRRWLDAEGDIHVGEQCDLGINISSGGSIFLGKNSIFRRVFAIPIITGDRGIPDPLEMSLPPKEPSTQESAFIRSKSQNIPKGSILRNNVVFTRKVTIGSNTLIQGNVKAYDEIVLEENVTIDGNIFADASIFIGPDARITGNVFSQKSVHISRGTIISNPLNIKSVIGKKEIHIEPNVLIYGFISTEGNGIVL